ncbi:MAG TPA: metalloregulator ArsR/SmtB family transcription factor [Thermoanaerobaculia bacterium]|nr:metalloregulator ArsR/SmtB family transcription factor [Thermoanaerobaculia bacterium]
MVNYSLDTTFAALADPTRRAILAKLASAECTISELAEPFDMSLPAVSKHVRVLEHAGLLVREIDGRVHRCNIDPEPIASAASWIDDMRHFWESRLGSLADYLNQMEDSWQEKSSKSGEPTPRRPRKSSGHGPTRKK